MGDLNYVENTGIAGMKNDKHLIFGVTWAEAKEYCLKISQKTGKKYRLPSEAEWEYAASTGSTTDHAFGETIDLTLVNFCYSGSIFNFPDRSVAKFYPNAFGLYQMHGIVDELCEDVWNPNYHNSPLNGSARTTGTSPTEHVISGGNFQNRAFECRSASIDGVVDGKRTFTIRFRIVGEVR